MLRYNQQDLHCLINASNHLTFLTTDLSSAVFKMIALVHLSAMKVAMHVWQMAEYVSYCRTGAALHLLLLVLQYFVSFFS